MKPLLLSPPPLTEEETFAEGSAPLNIVVVFADTTLAKKSAEIYNELIEQFAPDCVFHASWWRFDRLLQPAFFEAARRVASGADIILIAAAADEDLPAVVKAWVDVAFVEPAAQDRLLIALFGAEVNTRPVDSAANEYLRAAAREAGMEYLHRWVVLPQQRSNGSLKHTADRANAFTPLLAEILSQATAIPHGGINE